MRRREFMVLIGSAAAFPFSAGAQQSRRVVGVLLPYIEGESQAKARVAVLRTSPWWSEGGSMTGTFSSTFGMLKGSSIGYLLSRPIL